MRPQIFRYVFPEPKDGDRFVSLEHIRHAISNSDQYPVTPGAVMVHGKGRYRKRYWGRW